MSNLSLIKHSFFDHTYRNEFSLSFKEKDFDLDQLKAEFFSLYQLLLSNKQHWTQYPELVLCLNFICDALITYYQIDYVSSELSLLREKKKEIEMIHQKLLIANPSMIHEFPMFLFERLKNNLHEYRSALKSISQLRDKVGSLNTKRSQFVYSRSLATHLLTFLQQNSIAELIHEINIILGNQYSFIDGIQLLNKSSQAIATLGIILYTFRFMVNLIMMVKHLIHAALHNELSADKVLMHELEKRGFIMASDLVWSVVGLLTTFNKVFHIAANTIAPLILSFLIFDALLLIAQWIFEANKYNQRLSELNKEKENATFLEQIIIQRQIDLLKDTWEAQCAYYTINIIGASILAFSFAMTMICTGPLLLASLALFSMIGNALYNSAEEYKKVHQAKLALKREITNGEFLHNEHHVELAELLHKEYDQAHLEFWKTFGFNVGGITFIITATVASWPIAVALTILYIGYQLNKTYQKQLLQNNAPEMPHDIYRFLSEPPNNESKTSLLVTLSYP